MKKFLRSTQNLLFEARSEIIGGIVVALLLGLFSQIPTIFNRIRGGNPKEDKTSMASNPSEVNADKYPLPSESIAPTRTSGSSYEPSTEPTFGNTNSTSDPSVIGTELWRIDLPGELQTSPVLSDDGTIYLVTSSGVMLVIDSSGNELWRVVLGGASVTRNYSLPVPTEDNHVYIVYDGELLSLSGNGVLDWSFSKPYAGSLTAQPAVGLDGTIYLMTNDSLMLAVSSDGKELWSQSLCKVMGGGTWPGPAVGTDGTVYGVCKGEDIYALDPANGNILWTYHTNDSMESTPAAGDDGSVYFASTGGWVIAMRPDGKPRWQNSVAGGSGYIQMIDAPVVLGKDGLIYVTPRHGSIYALDPATGKIQWSVKIGGQGVGNNPIAITSDGTVFARNLPGDLFHISPSGEIVSQISPSNEDGGFSPPAIGYQDELYLAINELLIAYQVHTK